jgi:hypothetical protein
MWALFGKIDTDFSVVSTPPPKLSSRSSLTLKLVLRLRSQLRLKCCMEDEILENGVASGQSDPIFRG